MGGALPLTSRVIDGLCDLLFVQGWHKSRQRSTWGPQTEGMGAPHPWSILVYRDFDSIAIRCRAYGTSQVDHGYTLAVRSAKK
jgi:hypothetical protein